MRKGAATVGSLLFLVACSWHDGRPDPLACDGLARRLPPPNAAIRSAGLVLILVGAAVLFSAFAGFVLEGLGTPAPFAPTERLVVGGLYRHVRTPMYLAVASTIVGWALLLGPVRPARLRRPLPGSDGRVRAPGTRSSRC